MSVPSNTILRVVVSLLFPDSAIAQNVFYTLFENDGGSNDDEDVLTDMSDWVDTMYDAMSASLDSDITLTGIKVYFYDTVGDDWDELGVEFPGTGFSATGDMMPNGIACLIHAPTVNPDVTGAKYIGGFLDDSVVENDITAGALANFALFATEWTDPAVFSATGSGFIPGVWSATKDQFFAFTTSSSLNVGVAYQRRRKPGVGI